MTKIIFTTILSGAPLFGQKIYCESQKNFMAYLK